MEKKFRDLTTTERIEFIQARTATRNDTFLNNSRVLQRLEQKIADITDEAKKDFLIAFYSKCHDVAHVAAATIYKGVLLQDRAFFAISQDYLIEMLKMDPDNTLEQHKYLKPSPKAVETGKPTAKLSRLTAGFYLHGIEQLWNSSGRGKAAAFVIVDPIALELMGLTKEELKAQYKDLQEFCANYTIPEDWVFDSVGEMRIEKEKIKNKLDKTLIAIAEHIKNYPDEKEYAEQIFSKTPQYDHFDFNFKGSEFDISIYDYDFLSEDRSVIKVTTNSDVPPETVKIKEQNPAGKNEKISNSTITILSNMEPTVKCPANETQNDLSKFLNEERVDLLKDWFEEARHSDISFFSNAFRISMAASLVQFMKSCSYDEENFVLDLSVVLKNPKLSAFGGLAKKCFLDCAKENRLFIM